MELIDMLMSADALPLLDFIREITEGQSVTPEERDFLFSLRAKLPGLEHTSEAMDSDRLREISGRIKSAISIAEG